VRGSRGGLAVLGLRNYRLSWPVLLITSMGQLMWQFVTSYLIYSLTGSSFLTQLVTVAYWGPLLVFGVFAGLLVDAVDRRRLMTISVEVMALLNLATAALLFAHAVNEWGLLALTLAMGIMLNLNSITRRTFTFDLVGRNQFLNALAFDNIGMTIGSVLGPFVGGLLLDLYPRDVFIGAAASYAFMFLLYVLAGWMLRSMVPNWVQEIVPAAIATALGKVQQGLRFVARSRTLIGILGITVLFNVAWPSRFLLPAFQAPLGISAAELGLLGAAPGIGGLAAGIFLAARARLARPARYYWVGSAMFSCFTAVFAVATTLPVAFGALLVSGIGQTLFGTMQTTLIVLSVPADMRGRITGILSVAIGVMTIGSVVIGLLAEAIGPGAAVLLIAGLVTLATLAWTAVFREMRHVGLD